MSPRTPTPAGLTVERRETASSAHVLVLSFARPAARNAIDSSLADALEQQLKTAAEDDACACVLLLSEVPRVFLAGGDLNELRQLLASGEQAASAVVQRGHRLAAIERCPVPVIAGVHGKVLGGGCELLLMCDVILMERSASLRFVHGRMGLTPAWGGSTRLLERVGSGGAAALLYRGGEIDADEALRLGIAQQLLAEGRAREDGLAFAHAVAAHGRGPLIQLKRSLSAAKHARRGASLEQEAKVFRAAFGSPRMRQAIDTFFKSAADDATPPDRSAPS